MGASPLRALSGNWDISSAEAPKILNYNPAMKYRPMGNTGVLVSEISLGGLVMAESVHRYAIEHGVNLVHVGWDYLGGQSIKAGQKVQIWEGSANRDESVFDRADEFDITRKPNPHLGFGQGVHYCLGANLARLELRVLFEELLSRFGAMRVVKPVEWTRSNRHTGIRHLVVKLLEEQ